MRRVIAVFGSSAADQASPLARRAEEAGRALAGAGFGVITGGYGGVMEAASRGARQARGEAIGVTCAVFANRDANRHLTEEVRCQTLLERISTLMDRADGYMVLGGNIGTLAELFLAWNLLATGGDKPLILVGDDLRLALTGLCRYTEISEKQLGLLRFSSTVAEGVEALAQELRG